MMVTRAVTVTMAKTLQHPIHDKEGDDGASSLVIACKVDSVYSTVIEV